MSNKPLVFLDFDETLFNHVAFIDWLDNYLLKHGFIAEKHRFRDTLWEYHTSLDDKHRLYRHRDHVNEISTASWEFLSAEVEAACMKESQDFCYDDAHVFVDWLIDNGFQPRILTFGDGEYQRYKIHLCPHLRSLGLPIHVVNAPKRDFLRQSFPTTPGILIDDKYPLGIQSPWSHAWLDRTAARKPIVEGQGNVYYVTNLLEVTDLLNDS